MPKIHIKDPSVFHMAGYKFYIPDEMDDVEEWAKEGYEMHNSRSLSDSYSWIVFKKENVTYEIQLTKSLV